MTPHALRIRAAAELELRRRRAARAFGVQDICAWIDSHYRIPETADKRMVIVPYQRRALQEALAVDESGNFIYNTIVWSDIKKSLKSSIAAAYALYTAMVREYASVYVIANDLKQADSRVAYYIRRAIELNPDLQKRAQIRRYHIQFDNHSTIEAIPIDPAGEAGSNADLLVFSELWAWKSEAAQRMWSEMTLSPTKFGKSQRFCETYAGFVGESPVLEQLYDTGVKQGTRIDHDVELYSNKGLLALWNTVPRHAWQTDAYYASEEQILHPSEFQRMHRNQWGQSSSPFVPYEWWKNCAYRAGDPSDFSPGKPLVLALDAGVSDDLFAVVGVSRHAGRVYVRFVQTYAAPPGGKMDFETVEADVLALCSRHAVECVTYDPYQLESMAQRLAQSGRVYMREFNQGQARAVADKLLYDAIRERRIIHADDETLNAHVRNANVETTDKLMRIVKRSHALKVDALVALSMAHAVAVELEL